MVHRSLVAVAVAMLGAVGGCGGSDSMATSCALEQHSLAATPLTLLPDARIDTVGDGFVLLGSDADGAKVRWANLGLDGTLGSEHEIDVPPHDAGPWFAVAGAGAPGNRLVVAYVDQGSTGGGTGELKAFAVGIDGTLPQPELIAGRVPVGAGVKVAVTSGRGGMRMGLAFGITGSTRLAARLLDGDGRAMGADLPLGTVSAFDCLRFLPGKGDLTIGYVDESGTPPDPTFVATEITSAGIAQAPFRLRVGKELPECMEMVPIDAGYGIAWHTEGIGFSFGVFEPNKGSFASRMFLGDVRFLPAKAPPLGGLGWMGKSYAVGFARPEGAEVRLIDGMGYEAGKLPVFPSAMGRTGGLSTQPVGQALYATYADYTDAGATSGRRFFVKVTCP